jgi:NADH-quinone oxidoreductase subunit J
MDPIFLLTSAVAIAAGVNVVTQRNPVYSAVFLLAGFLSVAVTFLLLSAPFLAAIHVVVYTGAILVLFLFVIMLLNLREDEYGDEYSVETRGTIAVLCSAMFGVLAWAVLSEPGLAVAASPPKEAWGSVEGVGMLLFTTYGLPFELVSLLIIVAMFGAMVLAKKHLTTAETSPGGAK